MITNTLSFRLCHAYAIGTKKTIDIPKQIDSGKSGIIAKALYRREGPNDESASDNWANAGFFHNPKIVDSLPVPHINGFKISGFALRRFYTNLASKIAYLPVHFASLCVDHPRDSAAIPAVIALIETKMTCGILYDI